MQKCEVPYKRSSGRREILNLGIPLGAAFRAPARAFSLSAPLCRPVLVLVLVPLPDTVFLLFSFWVSPFRQPAATRFLNKSASRRERFYLSGKRARAPD